MICTVCVQVALVATGRILGQALDSDPIGSLLQRSNVPCFPIGCGVNPFTPLSCSTLQYYETRYAIAGTLHAFDKGVVQSSSTFKIPSKV